MARFQGRQPKLFGIAIPGVITRLSRADAFALTFDACGGGRTAHGYDAELIQVLRDHSVPATLFLNARWVGANRAVAEALAADPLFELANHGTRHVPLTVTGRAAYGIAGTRSVSEAYDEVAQCQQLLTGLLGRAPRFFRSGTAHLDDIGLEIAAALGVKVVNFSVNADAGATASSVQVARQLRQVAGGDIVIGHFNRPAGQTAEGVAAGLQALLAKGLKPVRLGEGLAIS